MGGVPLNVLQIVGFPKDEVPIEILGEILEGGASVLIEANVAILGGHSVVDKEIKYGMAVIGTVHPKKVIPNSGARVGDILYLTKPLGMGPITTAHKKEKVDLDTVKAACEVMARLNKDAALAMIEARANAATDITGFGFLGHAAEIARGSTVTLEVRAKDLPIMQKALELATQGITSGASGRTREFLGDQVRFAPEIDEGLKRLLYDAETSGGLLISVSESNCSTLEAGLQRRNVPIHRIGRVLPPQGVFIALT